MSSLSATSRYTGFVLAVHLNSRGFGWVLFENAHTPVAWSLVRAGAANDARLLSRFKRVIDRYEPRVVVFEAFDQSVAHRSDRIQRLYRAMGEEAKKRGVETPIFDREVVQLAFAKFGASTRPEIAAVIAKHIPAFAHRLPRERKFGAGEDARQCLFDATAVAITYFTYRGELD
tara:strand:- start:20522 stop:21043 length:522 start_codon:yes stop_codon:yes gene_type:complete